MLDFSDQPANNFDVASVVLQDLTKSFKHSNGAMISAVNNVTLEIADREFFVLLGPSGCGKTTTLRLIAGLEKPTGGTVSLNGSVANDLPPKERDIAMVFQSPALYPHMSVYENMAFGLKLRGCPVPQIRDRVMETADLLELVPHLRSMPQHLSGGERQRVALGRAIVRRPQLYLLDEPLSNLDPALRAQMRSVITSLHERLGSTMIYVTHDQVEALSIGTRVAVMRNAELQQVAAPLVLYQQPANIFVAGFIGAPPMNLFHGMLVPSESGLIFLAPATSLDAAAELKLTIPEGVKQEFRDYINKPVIMGLRAENIGPISKPDAQSIEAQVIKVQSLGAETWVQLAKGPCSFMARFPADTTVMPKQRIHVLFNLAAAHFYDPTTQRAVSHGYFLSTNPH